MMRRAPWMRGTALLGSLCSLLCAGTGRARPEDDVAALLRGEPDIRAVQRAAVDYVDARPEDLRRLLRDARRMGALPDVSLDGSTSLDRGVDRDALDHVEGSDQDRSWDVSLEIEWDLSDLAMSYERVRAMAEQQRRMELRATVLEEVTRAYYDRQRARAALRFDPGLTAERRVLLEIELREHTARLDALTDGAFGRLLEERAGGS